ncbi:hypothetical protein [Raoultella terrigena]|uniref:Uncharacterized protein n=1 Tax=Raoultella terrigena TaxID=577 RepID=A0A7Z9CRP9_RAOTE|nr:hypothetical protein [Raoultella terrigena]QIT27730.1 hypothetical protein HCK03_07115 [Raoultella terrigena]VED48146.1 Uncharacterised protein [Raoultella terrigena]
MSWERQKSTISAKPEEPSFILWMMLGVLALVGCVLLFVLHANQLAGPLQTFNLWAVTAFPAVIWFFFLCLRGWLYNNAVDKHEFESGEAEFAQQQWMDWAGRNITVLHSGVMLPVNLTSQNFLAAPPSLEQSTSLTRRICLHDHEAHFFVLLAGLNPALAKLPSDIEPAVTLLTDSQDDLPALQDEFVHAWQTAIPDRLVPLLTILKSKSFLSLDERIKSPTLDVDLILVHQTKGRDAYSDVLAVLLLTSDDVATKYKLSFNARLLRPMALDMAISEKSLDTFFSTQTQACATASIVGDRVEWGNAFSDLLAAAQDYDGHWKPEQLHWLEKYAGLSGPFSPWVMAAVASDIVNIQKTDCLMLSTDGEQKFINTVQTGNRNDDHG